MENDKDIKIETGEDVGLDDKIKAGARALGKKIEDPILVKEQKNLELISQKE
jgi:hypothetical protein